MIGRRQAIGVVLCPGCITVETLPPLGLRARERLGNMETEKLSEESSDLQTKNTASHGNLAARLLGGKLPQLHPPLSL